MSDARRPPASLSAERTAAFADAVVAIAMTLLILPLMDSVADVAGADHSAEHWFAQHLQQLVSFVVSFAIIAMFWINHHRMFSAVRGVTVGLVWLTVAWLLSIVWLPVATAMSGQFDDDALVKSVYIGSMMLTAVLSLAGRLYLRTRPELHAMSPADMRGGIAVDLSMIVLFALALAVALLWPVIGLWSLLLMTLTGVVQGLLARRR